MLSRTAQEREKLMEVYMALPEKRPSSSEKIPNLLIILEAQGL
jgi:hypothetical protein